MDAYNKKLILTEDLGNELYAELMESRIRSERGESPDNSAIPSPGMWRRTDTGEFVVGRMRAALEMAPPFWVAPQMTELITAAAETMPDASIDESDLPSSQGFMTIPGGLAMIDVRGQLLSYDSVLWDQTPDGVDLFWFTDKYDEKDATNLVLRRDLGRNYEMLPQLTIAQTLWLKFNEPVPRMIANGMILPPELSTQVFMDPDTGNIMVNHVKGYTTDELRELVQPRIKPDPITMWLIACWRLMGQTLTSLVAESVPRGLRRQAERRGMNNRGVTVITLRRRSVGGESGEHPVDWSHRWLVRGHWRNQRYKLDGEWTTKLRWIHPHIKGPDDKPLRLREHVYALTR